MKTLDTHIYHCLQLQCHKKKVQCLLLLLSWDETILFRLEKLLHNAFDSFM